MPKERDYQKSTTQTRQVTGHITWRHLQLADGTRPQRSTINQKKIVVDKGFGPKRNIFKALTFYCQKKGVNWELRTLVRSPTSKYLSIEILVRFLETMKFKYHIDMFHFVATIGTFT